jgi:hypothetical protein
MSLEAFREAVRQDVEEFLATGRMHRAAELSAATGQHLNHNEYPLFFVGDPAARLVLVHLNPKQPDNFAVAYQGQHWLPTFDAYWEHHRHFGARVYGPSSPRTHRSPFDHKQIRFLRPFGVINFGGDVWANLERAIDQKLQLELVPYGSAAFEAGKFPPEVLRPHWERVLGLIASYPRDYVLFCGAVFEPLVREHVVEAFEFSLAKKDGSATRQKARFSRLRFEWGGQTISAGLAHSFARQGIPMDDYGQQCAALYG